MRKNLPVPDGFRAPMGCNWSFWIGLPALIVLAYRLIPPRIRSLWSLKSGHSTSHLALAAILAGGGWAALWHFAVPSADVDWYPHYHHRKGSFGGWSRAPFDNHVTGPSLGWKEDYGRS